MTPTEQDDELREKLWEIFKHDSLASSRAGSPSQKTEEAINSLITADRKRVALEARLDELERLQAADMNLYKNVVIAHRIAELEAQQEEVR